MASSFVDCEIPVELERRLATFDESLAEVADILKSLQKVPYSDVCAQVSDVVVASKRLLDNHIANTGFFLEFTEATRTTGGLSKHRQKPYNAYYPNNYRLTVCFRLQFPFQTIFKLIYCVTGYTRIRQCIPVINYSVVKCILSQVQSTAFFI